MVFTKALRPRIKSGRIRCSIRIWTRPHVKAGGRYPMDDGHIVVDSIVPIDIDDVTHDLARESGFESVDDLLQIARHGPGDNVYLIRFHYLPPGAWNTTKPQQQRKREHERWDTLMRRPNAAGGVGMAKRDGGKRVDGSSATTNAPAEQAAGTMEERIVAFAEQLGRIVGTVQAKTDGWMDRDTLSRQIASVRDSAAGLLEQLAGTTTEPAGEPAAAPIPPGRDKGRSGGVVDAPGKKHRKPPPAGPRAKLAASQAAKMRSAKTMVKTNRRRGRG